MFARHHSSVPVRLLGMCLRDERFDVHAGVLETDGFAAFSHLELEYEPISSSPLGSVVGGFTYNRSCKFRTRLCSHRPGKSAGVRRTESCDLYKVHTPIHSG